MYKRILVPVDGSQTSNRALVAALQMARDGGGSIRLIHVIEELAQVIAYDPYGASSGDLSKVMRENGQQTLTKALDIARSAGVSADQRLVEAAGQRLAEAVHKEAAAYGADLIVLGTHGRRGLSHLMLGSVAAAVVHESKVPVLVVKTTDA
jgi:nucleotide-binding universal stress UspA family protein